MPIQLLIEIINALLVLSPQIPAIVSLGESAVNILKTGSVSPEDEARIRSELDDVKRQIDAA
jgi:hypothetical protein